ncbi:MAG: hypothetical protein J6T10_00570 [Methanobrevibacter sp.]|nr:hypothetical protein [Methanobrevibacter sp.]
MIVYDKYSFNTQRENPKKATQQINAELYIGLRFGKLVVLEYAGQSNSGKPLVRCVCDCGSECIKLLPSLKNGHTISCGCYHKEELAKRNFKHGNTIRGKKTRLYICWNNMMCRCKYEDTEFHEYYIDKGITVCDEWKDFSKFEKWAKTNGYRDDLTIDRINSYNGYCPENCRWIPMHLNIRRATFKRDYGYDPTDVEVEEKYGRWEDK